MICVIVFNMGNRAFALIKRDQLSPNTKKIHFKRMILAPTQRTFKNYVTCIFSAMDLKIRRICTYLLNESVR